MKYTDNYVEQLRSHKAWENQFKKPELKEDRKLKEIKEIKIIVTRKRELWSKLEGRERTINQRRGLGFKPLNFPLNKEGFEGHHFTKNLVIFIPSFLHHSKHHNIFTGKGMKEMNKKALNFLIYGSV